MDAQQPTADHPDENRTWRLKKAWVWTQAAAAVLWGFNALIIYQRLPSLIRQEATTLEFAVLGLAEGLLGMVICASLVCFGWGAGARTLRLRHGEAAGLEVEARWPFFPTLIPRERIGEIHSWNGVVRVRVRSDSSLRDRIRYGLGLWDLTILRRQFPDRESWEGFAGLLKPGGAIRGLVREPGDYPPRYPEIPCPGCGLTIPAYDAHCPNCATPRDPGDR